MGQSCPEEQAVIGFDLSGNIICSLGSLPYCGDGIQNLDEECDDGNEIVGDGCSKCLVSICGNGRLDALEQCEDSNSIGGDGCNVNCQIEALAEDPEPGALKGITRAHNNLRHFAGSQPLEWDQNIADQAQAWADSLYANGQFFHNPNFSDFSNGENLAMWVRTAAECVDLWASEIVETDQGIACNDWPVCGHYGTIIHPNFTKIGCGVTSTPFIWVCNYSY
jgi:cysteine-rich repeat protein